MMSVASRPLLSGPDLDRAIDRARTELTALLQGSEMRGYEMRVPEMRGSANGSGPGVSAAVAEARALLGVLLIWLVRG